MAEVPLHGERNNCSYDGIVYATKMGILEVFYVAKSSNKPIVDVGPGERSLNGLQQKDGISCSRFAINVKGLKRKTDLEVLRIVGLWENCSYIHLDIGEWTKLRFRGTGIVQIWTTRMPYKVQLNRGPKS
jgi:hypothetical protein